MSDTLMSPASPTTSGPLQVSLRPEDGPGGPRLRLLLSGEIDVHATPVLAALQAHADAPGAGLTLDFSGVARCNSMGLAQLLRLLEHWRAAGLQPAAAGLNRTLAMLFKMTGLMRYFAADAAAGAATGGTAAPAGGVEPDRPLGPATGGRPPVRPVGTPQMRRIVRPGAEPAAPAAAAEPTGTPTLATETAQPATTAREADAAPHGTPQTSAASATPAPSAPSVASTSAPPTTAPADARLDFHVSQQNTQQLTGWYYLNTLLQRALGRAVSLTVDDLDHPAGRGAAEAARPTPALVFARPFDACALMDDHGYQPVARPQDDSDEVSLVVRRDEPRTTLAEFAGARTTTAQTRSFVQVLGRFFCDECGLDSAGLQRAEAGSEIAALKALLAGQADLLFMSSRGHARLSALARSGVRVLDHSETGVASHLLLVHPACADALRQPLRAALTGLGGHDKGRQALQDLGMAGWDVPADDEIEMLLRLYRRYAD